MKNIEFIREGLRNLQTVGTLTRSSKQLCKALIKHVDFQNTKLIVELGAGDGVITKHILQAMRPDAKLLAFEVNPRFCEQMRQINDDRLVIIEDSAEHLERYVNEAGFEQIDFIISAIPFVALPKEAGKLIVNEAHKCLKQSGRYIQVHYSLVMKQLYSTVFGNVDVNFVPLNVPPAFVLVSEKNRA
jgi:phospholipid N-methyltransferase